MEQKRVSFEVAKALKEAGYPLEYSTVQDTIDGNSYHENGGEFYLRPYYVEVWLWLCREKKIYIRLDIATDTGFWYYAVSMERKIVALGNCNFSDPEEAITAAIEYLVTNNLIK